jgi:hypothetical protein
MTPFQMWLNNISAILTSFGTIVLAYATIQLYKYTKLLAEQNRLSVENTKILNELTKQMVVMQESMVAHEEKLSRLVRLRKIVDLSEKSIRISGDKFLQALKNGGKGEEIEFLNEISLVADLIPEDQIRRYLQHLLDLARDCERGYNIMPTKKHEDDIKNEYGSLIGHIEAHNLRAWKRELSNNALL